MKTWLHVWEIGSGFRSLSAHVLVRPGDDCHADRRDIEGLISERFEACMAGKER